jgi:hypothetical protein
MNHEHLTDDQLQEILDARMLHAGSILPLHLGACAACQLRLESFERLYDGLAADPGFVLPPAFADSVLDRLPGQRPLVWQRPAARIALMAAAAAVILSGLLLFVDMSPLLKGAVRTYDSFKAAFMTMGGQMKQLLAWLGVSAKPLLLGGLSLVSAFVLDRILFRQMVRHSQ